MIETQGIWAQSLDNESKDIFVLDGVSCTDKGARERFVQRGNSVFREGKPICTDSKGLRVSVLQSDRLVALQVPTAEKDVRGRTAAFLILLKISEGGSAANTASSIANAVAESAAKVPRKLDSDTLNLIESCFADYFKTRAFKKKIMLLLLVLLVFGVGLIVFLKN